MIDGLPPSQQALYGTLFTWFVTALGSAVVFVEPILPGSPATHQLFLDTMLGFAGGVMIAASYWSLLAPGASLVRNCARASRSPPSRCLLLSSLVVPAIAMAEQDWYGKEKFAQIDLSNGISKEVTYAWLPAAVGFAAGGLFLVLGDYVRRPSTLVNRPALRNLRCSHLTRSCMEQLIGLMLVSTNAAEAAQAKKDDGATRAATTAAEQSSLELAAAKSGSWRRILLLVFAITLHNIPEGLAVGVRIQWHMQGDLVPCGALNLSSCARLTTSRSCALCVACRSPSVAWALRLARSSTHAASRTRLT